MLTLTRPQRQALATLAVLALLVAPSAFIAWNAWKLRRPDHRLAVAAALSNRLGARVTLDQVSYPRPGETLLKGVVIRQDEPGAKAHSAGEIARAAVLRLRSEGQLLRVEADGLTLRAAGPRQALAQLGTLLQRVGADGTTEVSLLAASCHIEPGAGLSRFRLQDVAGMLKVEARSLTLSASLRLDAPGAPRCELSLVRDRQANGLHTTLTVRTADKATLPASALNPFFASDSWLGPDALVEGELVLHQINAGDWDAQFRGRLDNVDLATLAGRLAPEHQLRGRGRIEFQDARWTDLPGRGAGWSRATGTLTARAGTIGTGLLRSLRDSVHFRLDPALDLAAEGQEFQSLGLRFEIAPSGTLQLAGALGPDLPPDTVALHARGREPLLSAPEAPARITGLIRALAPARLNRPDEVIPARFESLVIQRYLPASEPPGTMEPGEPLPVRTGATTGPAMR